MPSGNGLEALKDDRKGQHSIRINVQWRLCFVARIPRCSLLAAVRLVPGAV
ncbi:MAG: hypothetical protein EST26_01965 [Hydrogenophaga sp.]|nr:hypothetical protein [Hydrogenophaga sp.]